MLACSYAEFEHVLKNARALPEPSEAHGTLAGALCSAGEYSLIDWLREILPEDSPEEAIAHDVILEGVYSSAVRALIGNDADFEPMLPDDEAPLAERAEALSLWCQGFLYGLGSGAVSDPARVSSEAGEIIRDLTEITHVGIEGDEENEDDEKAFAEVVEFVRVGVQLLFVELAPARGREPAHGAASVH